MESNPRTSTSAASMMPSPTQNVRAFVQNQIKRSNIKLKFKQRRLNALKFKLHKKRDFKNRLEVKVDNLRDDMVKLNARIEEMTKLVDDAKNQTEALMNIDNGIQG